MDKRILLLLILIIAGITLYWFFKSSPNTDEITGDVQVRVDKTMYAVTVADTVKTRQQGLSGRKELREGEGMLFVFGAPSTQAFWMKGMLFPIDIIWINDGIVTGFVENAKPDHNIVPEVYSSPSAVKYVLEVPAGTVQKDKIEQGDPVEIIGYTTNN